ncbi:unnamed protein product [Brassicogethes aeneus]|uniref:Histone deacetylase 8 n=1 Tax=Brassicogethes aeneus TaxID=1431903 RepID=A0A9P0BDV5_BRAAE|nr:unnamed protein product [Brassicogethes aeneus]
MSIIEGKVAYIFSGELVRQCNRLPTMKNRASIVQDLITSYKLLYNDNMAVVLSEKATEEELKLFHSTSFVEFMKKINDLEDFEDFDEEQVEFGLGYDCPILENMFDFARVVAGGSLTAAKLLAAKKCRTAINWFGGWHHAQRDSAEGFCYVNDIVIAIQKLSEVFDKILYVDLDVHHGNGVQNAFEMSKKILTLSFHKLIPGFYPGTGNLDDIGSNKGKYYSINVPYLSGISHNTYLILFDEIFAKIVKKFKPQCLVIQCGADTLRGDPIGEGNLTLKTMGECVKKIMDCKLPTLYLGGGGYNFPNTARLWAYLTSLILKCDLDDDIPDSCDYFTQFVPTYELHIDPSLQKDENKNNYVEHVIKTVESYCEFIC